MKHRVEILQKEFITHDVKRFVIEKPKGYVYKPGQVTNVAIDKSEWKENKHPFTFTSLNNDKILEFIIKSYPISQNPKHSGMTEKLHTLVPGDNLLIDDPWGTIEYKGQGTFIAGGAGITPFIAIFRELQQKSELEGNRLIFSNKTRKDIILEKELRHMFGDDLILVLTEEEITGYYNKRIDKAFLEENVLNSDTDANQNFYLCGPPKMIGDLKEYLGNLGISLNTVVFER
jgi:predicted ferric reductase